MMMLNVSHIFASENQVKNSWTALNYETSPNQSLVHNKQKNGTHQSLNMKEEHSYDPMIRLVNPVKIDKGINRGGEGAVQPPSSLTDELCRRLRDVSLSFTRLDICKRPFLVLLGNELKA
jgi:hypothetical protein